MMTRHIYFSHKNPNFAFFSCDLILELLNLQGNFFARSFLSVVFVRTKVTFSQEDGDNENCINN